MINRGKRQGQKNKKSLGVAFTPSEKVNTEQTKKTNNIFVNKN